VGERSFNLTGLIPDLTASEGMAISTVSLDGLFFFQRIGGSHCRPRLLSPSCLPLQGHGAPCHSTSAVEANDR